MSGLDVEFVKKWREGRPKRPSPEQVTAEETPNPDLSSAPAVSRQRIPAAPSPSSPEEARAFARESEGKVHPLDLLDPHQAAFGPDEGERDIHREALDKTYKAMRTLSGDYLQESVNLVQGIKNIFSDNPREAMDISSLVEALGATWIKGEDLGEAYNRVVKEREAEGPRDFLLSVFGTLGSLGGMFQKGGLAGTAFHTGSKLATRGFTRAPLLHGVKALDEMAGRAVAWGALRALRGDEQQQGDLADRAKHGAVQVLLWPALEAAAAFGHWFTRTRLTGLVKQGAPEVKKALGAFSESQGIAGEEAIRGFVKAGLPGVERGLLSRAYTAGGESMVEALGFTILGSSGLEKHLYERMFKETLAGHEGGVLEAFQEFLKLGPAIFLLKGMGLKDIRTWKTQNAPESTNKAAVAESMGWRAKEAPKKAEDPALPAKDVRDYKKPAESQTWSFRDNPKIGYTVEGEMATVTPKLREILGVKEGPLPVKEVQDLIEWATAHNHIESRIRLEGKEIDTDGARIVEGEGGKKFEVWNEFGTFKAREWPYGKEVREFEPDPLLTPVEGSLQPDLAKQFRDWAASAPLSLPARSVMEDVARMIESVPMKQDPSVPDPVRDMVQLLSTPETGALLQQAKTPEQVEAFAKEIAKVASGSQSAQRMFENVAATLQAKEKINEQEAQLREADEAGGKEGRAKPSEGETAEAGKPAAKGEGQEVADVRALRKAFREDIEREPELGRLADLVVRTGYAEKASRPEEFSAEQRAMLESGDWESFSRSQGYSEREIEEFREYKALAERHRDAGLEMVFLANKLREGEGQEVAKKAAISDPEAGGVLRPQELSKEIDRILEGVDPDNLKEAAKEIVKERAFTIAGKKAESAIRAEDINEQFSAAEKADMIFYMERTGNPYADNTTAAGAKERLSPEAIKLVDENLKPLMESYHDTLIKSGLLSKEHNLENYLAHLWKMEGKQQRQAATKFFKTRLEHAQERRIPTYEEGIVKAGLEPRTTNIADIIQHYENATNIVLANRATLESLKKPLEDGTRLMMQRKDAPAEYVAIEHPALQIRNEKGAIVGQWVVHPRIKPYAEKMFEASWDAPKLLRAIELFGQVSKRFSLSWSFFHIGAEVESGVATGTLSLNPIPVPRLKKGRLSSFPSTFTDLAARLKTKKALISENAADAMGSGLTLNVTKDIGLRASDEFVSGVASRIEKQPFIGKLVKYPFKAVGKTQKMLDSALWDNLVPVLKLETWRRGVEKSLQDPKLMERYVEKYGSEAEAHKQIKRQWAADVNDAFGGQNWDAWFKTMRLDKHRRIWQMALLAPDWTFSNLRIAGKAGMAMLGRGPQATQAFRRRYFVRSAVALTAVLDAMQYLWLSATLSDDDRKNLEVSGRGLHIWDNEHFPSFRLWRNDEGRWVYAEPFKQIREVFRYFTRPNEIIGSKTSPLVKAVGRQMFGRDPGSTFAAPWEREGLEFWESLPSRALDVVTQFVPFSFGDNQFALMFPKRQETTPYRIGVELTKTVQAIADTRISLTNPDGTKADVAAGIEHLYKLVAMAKSNNIDPRAYLRGAIYATRGKLYGDLITALNDNDQSGIKRAVDGLSLLATDRGDADTALQKRFQRLAETSLTKSDVKRAARQISPREGGEIKRILRKEGR